MRVLLNKANLLANQKSELDFDIVDSKIELNTIQFMCFLKGVKNRSFIILAQMPCDQKWRTPEISYFYNLEKFCVDELNKNFTKTKVDLIQHMNSKLRSLRFHQE